MAGQWSNWMRNIRWSVIPAIFSNQLFAQRVDLSQRTSIAYFSFFVFSWIVWMKISVNFTETRLKKVRLVGWGPERWNWITPCPEAPTPLIWVLVGLVAVTLSSTFCQHAAGRYPYIAPNPHLCISFTEYSFLPREGNHFYFTVCCLFEAWSPISHILWLLPILSVLISLFIPFLL